MAIGKTYRAAIKYINEACDFKLVRTKQKKDRGKDTFQLTTAMYWQYAGESKKDRMEKILIKDAKVEAAESDI